MTSTSRTKTTSTSPPSSANAFALGPARVRWTGRAEGDLHPAAAGVVARQRRVLDRPWSTLKQVHGAGVHVVAAPPAEEGDVREADALVTAHPGAALCIRTADCAPVALASPEGVIGAVHAGWRGLVAGVVEAAVAAMRGLGATEVAAALGPCIHAGCYEFSPVDLAEVAARLGDGVRAETTAGDPALDVPAAVRAAVTMAGATLVHDEDVCTACSRAHWSHRARGERERQAMLVWLP